MRRLASSLQAGHRSPSKQPKTKPFTGVTVTARRPKVPRGGGDKKVRKRGKRKALAATQGKRRALAATQGKRRAIDLPLSLKNVLAMWGPGLRKEMEATVTAASRTNTSSRAHLVVGTDCAGLETPVLALRAMGYPHRHVFSSDIKPKIREYIRANSRQASVFPDMIRRDPAKLPAHNVYVCGFPCKPFSTLHSGSQKLKDKNAKPFFALLRTLRRCLPALVVLENVIGIRSVLKKIWAHLHALKWYEVLTFKIDPAEMGEPVRRPRYYFVLVRCDVAVCRGYDLNEFASKLAGVGIRQCTTSLSQRLLPSGSPHVQDWMTKMRQRESARAMPAPTEAHCPWC